MVMDRGMIRYGTDARAGVGVAKLALFGWINAPLVHRK